MKTALLLVITAVKVVASTAVLPYLIVDTGQTKCYDNHAEIAPPARGQPFDGQDAQYHGVQAAYQDRGDGTICDLNTGLIWVKARGDKMDWASAVAGAATCRVGGHHDWRMPTIKELYSLIDFNGYCSGSTTHSKPYLNTQFFDFVYGDEAAGVRIIDCQDWSATEYLGKWSHGMPTSAFGVNFADGRIKGYPKAFPNGRICQMFVRYVRGNPQYGKNDFHDHGDNTITDHATGLTWQKFDSGKGLNWQQALAYAASNHLAGHHDWRLPNAKELQSIVDYSRIPAIDPIFQISKLSDGEHPFYWTSTTHLDGPVAQQGSDAVYLCFGRALGWMQRPPASGSFTLMDVHGAGAQRSNPKSGDPSQFPHGRGPQGDIVRINHYVRLVRGGIPPHPPD